MTARFILSLDCEGKWGVADHLTRFEHACLSNERLRDAYRDLLDLLDEFTVPATFAFVGLFAESEQSFRRLMPVIKDLAARAPDYLQPALADIDQGSGQGWHGNQLVEAVSNSKTSHEIGLHGVTHVPWTSRERNFFISELNLLRELSPSMAGARTFVFPRNQVAHVDLLPSAQIEGYRTARPHKSRALSLLSEFNLWNQAERDPPTVSKPVQIPAGFFVNWRQGARRLVPKHVSTARVRALLARAEAGRVVHLWLHPENIASAPETLTLLRSMLEVVARSRDAGRCLPMTQLDYVRSLAAGARQSLPIGACVDQPRRRLRTALRSNREG